MAIHPSNAQTNALPVQKLQVGVSIGDQFSYRILNNTMASTGDLLRNLMFFPNDIVPPQVQDNQFQVKVQSFWDNNTQVCVERDNGCYYYTPVIALTYTSGNITDTHPEIYPGTSLSALIETSNWTYVKRDEKITGPASPNRSYQTETYFETHGSNQWILSYTEVTYSNGPISNETFSTNRVYDIQTGVLNYMNLLDTIYLQNGTSPEFQFRIVNKAYNGTTDIRLVSAFPNASNVLPLPFFIPIYMLIPIAITIKRRKIR